MSALSFEDQIRPLYCDCYIDSNGIAVELCDPKVAHKFVNDDNDGFRRYIFEKAAQRQNVTQAAQGEDVKQAYRGDNQALDWPDEVRILIRKGLDDFEWIYRSAQNEFILPWPPPPKMENSIPQPPFCNDTLKDITVPFFDMASLDPFTDLSVGSIPKKNDPPSGPILGGPCDCRTCIDCL